MKSASPKRERLSTEEEEENVDDDDDKMEKFYELIRNFNEARSRCGIHPNPTSGKKESKVSSQEKEAEDEEKVEDNEEANWKEHPLMSRPAWWKPCFKWEDFHHQNHSYKKRKIITTPSPSANHDDQQQSTHLDLNNLPL